MDTNYNIGQTLIIELEEECYIGEFKAVNKDRNRIELVNVSDFETSDKIDGVQIFYKSEIKSIRALKEEIDKETNTIKDTSENSSEKSEIQLNAIELQDIEVSCKNAKYIDKTDCTYYEAIADLKRQNQFVLNQEACESGRNSRTTILTICTTNNVYIFDIISLGGIFDNLKAILEAKVPKKIIHDGRKITDNLKYKQNVILNGIFDTFFAHIGVGGDKNITTLQECIAAYFNLPDKFCIYDKNVDWYSRPLSDSRKGLTAKKAILIYKLYNHLLHDYMLRGFYKKCEIFNNAYSNCDFVEAAITMSNKSNQNSSVDEIEEISLDFPVSVNNLSFSDEKL